MAQKKRQTARKEMLSDIGNFSNPKKKREHGVFDEHGRVTAKELLNTWHVVACTQCHFEGPVWKFAPSFSKYHDMRCPQCGSVKINTSSVNNRLKNYGFGNLNKIKKSLLNKNEEPEYGD